MNATLLGRTVLAGFAKGRAIAIAQTRARSTARAALIFRFAQLDQRTRFPARGRPGRIARATGIPEATVSRYLNKLSRGQMKVKDVDRVEYPPLPRRGDCAS